MKSEDKIRMLTVIAHANGMMTALSCMTGATITKQMSLTLEDQLDHMDEVLNELFTEAVKDDENCIPIIPASDTDDHSIDPDQ